ncbi:putative 15.0 kDa protein in dhaT-dhaS intergenic region [Cladophialophora carrionii]|uniref:Putative 15.0 kDa protein in dhaT-dhaS intergenic region n=1 Tax=Cladophialophora carrionii TaxID=86049 RepID=A0A1C1CLF7_9EURO|nr:putative 15.0 kDa protein in dhaT-dhaS intergenic region [Cladophialophora carrionii]
MAAIHRPAHLTHHAAKLASAACIEKSKAIGVPMNIAIVDASLYLLHFERMPGAKLTSIDISMNKAFTAAGHRAPTSVYKENVWPGGAAFGLSNSNNGRFMYVAGGIPIVIDGEVVGAIGCSTGTPAQDTEVAQAGIDAVMEYVKKRKQGQPKL